MRGALEPGGREGRGRRMTASLPRVLFDPKCQEERALASRGKKAKTKANADARTARKLRAAPK